MRSLADLFYKQGYHVLVLRMPGHGTVPAGLLKVKWQDWAAAVKVGARHVKQQLGAGEPFYMAGYSNGGALVTHHVLTALIDNEQVPDKLFLFSPAIGITPFARAARWDELYGFIPYFEKSKWVSIEIEYDPYKYNSFTKNAGSQSWNLAREIQSKLDEVTENGQLDKRPPVMAFQSIVDDTVNAGDLITKLYQRLDSTGNEVVFFDVNQSSSMNEFINKEFSNRLDSLMKVKGIKYTVTKLTNRNAHTRKVSAQSNKPDHDEIVKVPLELEWPENVFSLAHVAIPFPPNDPIYGSSEPSPPAFGLHIGTMSPIGERRVLKVSPSQLIRIRHNPFYSYIEQRITESIAR